LRADNLAALKALVLKAKAKDSLSAAMPPFGQQIFICENDSPILSAPQNSEYKVYGDATVDTVLYSGSNFEIGEIQNDTTFYVEIVDSIGITGERKRFVFSIQQPTADFSVASDTLLINTDEVNTFQFMDESEFASAWNWEFSNGITSSKQNPTIIVDEVGEFTAKLIITSNIGCQDTVSKTFQVYERAHRPKINDVELCRNEDLIISTPELNEITIYTDSLMQNQIFKGTEFTVGNLTTDTSFYIRNEVGDFPSTLIEFKAKIIPIKAKMDVIVDFSSENQELRGIARSNSEFANENIWLIDNDTIGTGNEIYFDLLKLKSGTLKLISISESNCMDSVSFDSSISKVPEFDNYYLCQNQDLILSSLNTEDLFYFEDKELTQFIGKGSRVEMREIDKNMSLFAVNVQNIHPSNVVEVPIYVSSLTADFNISHDTINLAYETDLQLESLSESATKWNWEINNQSIGQNKSVSHRLREAGVFEVQLTVSDTLGCTEILEKKLVVFNDPLLGNQKELRSYFSIFPNPANNFVHLTAKSQFKFDGYSVVDTKGKEVLKAKNDMPSLQTEIIDVSELKQGAYYLIIRKGKQEASFLFVISR
jgi:PKD repeat protein